MRFEIRQHLFTSGENIFLIRFDLYMDGLNETLQLCFIDRPALTLHPKTINGM